jgi:hypothetical protein
MSSHDDIVVYDGAQHIDLRPAAPDILIDQVDRPAHAEAKARGLRQDDLLPMPAYLSVLRSPQPFYLRQKVLAEPLIFLVFGMPYMLLG